MKYFLFLGIDHEYSGGAKDFFGIFDSIESAIRQANLISKSFNFDWGHIANENVQIVKTYAEKLSSGKSIYLGTESDEVEYLWVDGQEDRLYKHWYELPEWKNGSVKNHKDIVKLYEEKHEINI